MIHPSDRNLPLIEVKDTIGDLTKGLAQAESEVRALKAQLDEQEKAIVYLRSRKSYYKRKWRATERVIEAANLLDESIIRVRILEAEVAKAEAEGGL